MSEKLSKYENDETSEEILIFLRRNFSIIEHKLNFMDKPLKMLEIHGKSYVLEGNKKFLVNKLYNIVSDNFSIDEKIARRTIKKFIDGIS